MNKLNVKNRLNALGISGSATTTATPWFLTTGIWENNGTWKDVSPWPPKWFMITGTWNKNGIWKDEILL